MEARIRIGELATLVGVTQKTIRHYHAIGLLAEPERSEGGYRRYSVGHLLRLHRIRQLQSLGLSLRQIGAVLGEPTAEQSLRSVLLTLSEEITTQIQQLTERRERIDQLLAKEARGASDDAMEVPPVLARFRDALGPHVDVSPELWERETQVWATVDALAWSEPYEDTLTTWADRMLEHPEWLADTQMLIDSISALADLPENSPEVERQAEMFAKAAAGSPLFDAGSSADHDTEVHLPLMMTDVLLSMFTPAQQRFIRLVSEAGSPDRSDD